MIPGKEKGDHGRDKGARGGGLERNVVDLCVDLIEYYRSSIPGGARTLRFWHKGAVGGGVDERAGDVLLDAGAAEGEGDMETARKGSSGGSDTGGVRAALSGRIGGSTRSAEIEIPLWAINGQAETWASQEFMGYARSKMGGSSLGSQGWVRR